MLQSIPNGTVAVNAIEMLMLTWAGNKETTQLLIGTGCLKKIYDLSLSIAEGSTSDSVSRACAGIIYTLAKTVVVFEGSISFGTCE